MNTNFTLIKLKHKTTTNNEPTKHDSSECTSEYNSCACRDVLSVGSKCIILMSRHKFLIIIFLNDVCQLAKPV